MDDDGETPLDRAAFWEKRDAMVFLLDQGTKPTERTLLNTVNFGNIENLPLLIEHGAKLTAKVYLASSRAQEKLLPLLDQESISGISGTALKEAVECEDLPKIKALIAAGTKIDAPFLASAEDRCEDSEESGAQAIHFAADCKDPAIIVYLLENGSKADARTDHGIQPIHIAAGNGN